MQIFLHYITTTECEQVTTPTSHHIQIKHSSEYSVDKPILSMVQQTCGKKGFKYLVNDTITRHSDFAKHYQHCTLYCYSQQTAFKYWYVRTLNN